MILEVDGVEYEDFIAADATVSMIALSGTFSFIAAANRWQQMPFKGNEKCRVIVDGQPVITGNIERVEVSYSPKEHTISFSGRDSTCDLGDSSIRALNNIKAGIGLVEVCKRVIASIPGLRLGVVNNAGFIENFVEAEDLLAPEIGANAFDFLEQLARKRQVFLNTDGFGNLVISKTSNEKYNSFLQNVIGDEDNNNIISANAIYDYSNLYRNYAVESQLNTSVLNISGLIDNKTIVNQGGIYIDQRSRGGRQLVIESEQTSGDGQATKRARWEGEVRRARSRFYYCRVFGHSIGGEVWKPNKLVGVIDDFAGIDDIMLIQDVSYGFDVHDGTYSDLTLVQKDSFTLESQEPIKKKAGNVGDGLFAEIAGNS